MERICRKVIAFVIVVGIAIGIYIGTIYIIKYRKMSLPVGITSEIAVLQAYTRLCNEYDRLCDSETKEYYKNKIDQDLDVGLYFYSEKELDRTGYSNCYFRTIKIDERVSGYVYCETFTHETMHLKYYTANERFVCYETFKYLYESEELHNIGVWYGLKQLNGDYSGEYDISGLVVNYLTNK